MSFTPYHIYQLHVYYADSWYESQDYTRAEVTHIFLNIRWRMIFFCNLLSLFLGKNNKEIMHYFI